MATGFRITEVRFRGNNIDDVVVTFGEGLSVVAGPSNTGKSLLRSAINFVFGSGDPMKTVAEAAAYNTILVEVRTAAGQTETFARAWQGGDIAQYHTSASNVTATTPTISLNARHDAEADDNISVVLLALAGLSGIKLHKNQAGALRNLSFRDFVEYVLVSEERIITELSPIHTAAWTDRTYESTLFRFLLTGQDDKNLIAAPAKKDEKAHLAGQEAAIERFREDLTKRLPTAKTEEELRDMATRMDAHIADQNRLLQNYRTDLAQLEQQRRNLEQDHIRTLTRLTQVDANIKRFTLLHQQYESDLQRLQSTVEAGNLFADHPEGPCPVCGADPQYHQTHDITPAQLDEFTNACRAEAKKIQNRQTDLSDTVTQLITEQAALQAAINDLDRQRKETAKGFADILNPTIGTVSDSLNDLGEQRADIERALGIFEELRRLDELTKNLQPEKRTRGKKERALAGLPPDAYDDFAKTVETILRAWSYPELSRVVFDTKTEDLVVSGKARKDNGKGYRALTYAAFMIGVLQEIVRKSLPHPGFVILDSPLVTYREPINERMSEGVKEAFYRHLATTVAPAQVIVLENVEPPEDLKPQIAFEGFTANRTVGRYGLFQPLSLSAP